jgi:hypothetical protein
VFKAFPLFAMILSWPTFLIAQSSFTQTGARAAGIGYAAASFSDVWSIFNNVAGLSPSNGLTVGVSNDVYPGVKSFGKAALAITIPCQPGAIGAGIYRFGDPSYNELLIHAGFASTFGLASLGLKASYIQYSASGFGTRSVFSVSAGGIAELTPQLALAAAIYNINQPELAPDTEERLPTVLVAGIRFEPTTFARLGIEVEKDFDYEPVVKVGLECDVAKKIVGRTGVNVNPRAGFFGFGFKGFRLQIDYALQYFLDAGVRHQATINYQIKRPAP